MAYTAHKTEAAMEELRDSEEEFLKKVDEVASLLRTSRHACIFTGAGISTSAGIPDYRGPDGVWTLAAKGQKRDKPVTDLMKAVPTVTHLAIAELMRQGIVKHLISQNVDGLHRKSGVPVANFSELHGNANLEVCQGCKREFLRDYHVRCANSVTSHATGNTCPACGGALADNIVNFGENLPEGALHGGLMNSHQSDVHIVLGSSLTVRPACDMPRETASQGGKLVIVNLQRTPLDDLCGVRVHAKCDEFMVRLMERLGIQIPPFVLKRRLVISRSDGGSSVNVAGVDEEGLYASIFSRVTFKPAGKPLVLLREEPFTSEAGVGEEVSVVLKFFEHYEEPQLTLKLAPNCPKLAVDLSFNPLEDTEWTVQENPSIIPPTLIPITGGKGKQAQPSSSVLDQDEAIADLNDYRGWHAVTPLETCPHLEHGVHGDGLQVDIRSACEDGNCGNVGENMLCLQCGTTRCGRHVHQHMLAHHERDGHPLVCGFIDLSFWCYECDAYITPSNKVLTPIYVALHTAKFGHPPAGMTK